MKKIIWRSDDISHATNTDRFKNINELFIKYKQTQTVAIICKDLAKNQPLIDYINKNKIITQIHCWEHLDLTTNKNLKKDLQKCIKAIEKYFHKTPDTLFPPWNRSSDEVESVAKELGLTVSNKKVSLSYYIDHAGDVESNVINFHTWSDECDLLEEALKINNA